MTYDNKRKDEAPNPHKAKNHSHSAEDLLSFEKIFDFLIHSLM